MEDLSKASRSSQSPEERRGLKKSCLVFFLKKKVSLPFVFECYRIFVFKFFGKQNTTIGRPWPLVVSCFVANNVTVTIQVVHVCFYFCIPIALLERKFQLLFIFLFIWKIVPRNLFMKTFVLFNASFMVFIPLFKKQKSLFHTFSRRT